MDTNRLKELAGITLTENKNILPPDLQERAGKLLSAVNQFHGDIINAKRLNKVQYKEIHELEEALYKMASSLDKILGQ